MQTEEVRNLLYENLKNFVQEEVLHIKNVGANKEYKYIPYGGYYTKEDEIVADLYVKGDTKSYEIQYRPLGDFNFQELENTETSLESAYLEYVSEYDTEVSQYIEQSFQNEMTNHVMGRDVWGVMKEIQETLDKQADYSLRPGKTPKGKDVAEYFYFENKKGIL
ncbi:MAG: hypothetical protein ACLROG_06045 [Coprococcus phoceensis]